MGSINYRNHTLRTRKTQIKFYDNPAGNYVMLLLTKETNQLLPTTKIKLQRALGFVSYFVVLAL